RFSRGKFNISITWAGAGEGGEDLVVNETVADRYVALLRALAGRYGLADGLDLRTLAALPDVFTWEHRTMSDGDTWGLIREVASLACDNMNLMKAREGEALARDLEKRLVLVRQQLDIVVERAPLRPVEARDKLLTRIQALLGDVEV